MSLIEVKDLNYSYSKDAAVLKGLSFGIGTGEFMSVAGPNGSGKSTLINLLCGLLKPCSGTVGIDSQSINKFSPAELAGKVSVVRQEFIPSFGFTVIETVMMARTAYFSYSGFESSKDRDIVYEMMELTDIAKFAGRHLSQLSGGERQRVFIARALAQDTDILLLDEPTSFLDFKHQVGIYGLLKKMQTEKQKTIISITHDINLAMQYCDKALLLGDDYDYYCGDIDEVFTAERLESVFNVSIAEGDANGRSFFMPVDK